MPRHQALALHKTGRPVGSIDSVARGAGRGGLRFLGHLDARHAHDRSHWTGASVTGVEVGVLDDIIFRVDIAIWQG